MTTPRPTPLTDQFEQGCLNALPEDGVSVPELAIHFGQAIDKIFAHARQLERERGELMEALRRLYVDAQLPHHVTPKYGSALKHARALLARLGEKC